MDNLLPLAPNAHVVLNNEAREGKFDEGRRVDNPLVFWNHFPDFMTTGSLSARPAERSKKAGEKSGVDKVKQLKKDEKNLVGEAKGKVEGGGLEEPEWKVVNYKGKGKGKAKEVVQRFTYPPSEL